MSLEKSDPAFDALIEDLVMKAMPMLGMCKMVHSEHASALATSIDATLHQILVEAPIVTEAQARGFAMMAITSLARFYAGFGGRR
jgi:hypothetical protein